MEEKEFTEAIRIIITHKTLEKNNAVNAKHLRTIDVFMDGEDKRMDMVFSETESTARGYAKTKSGVAGAVNLLYDLLLEHDDAYYLNDYQKLQSEIAKKFRCRQSYRGQSRCKISKHFNFFRKLRFQFFQFKVKFFNIFK